MPGPVITAVAVAAALVVAAVLLLVRHRRRPDTIPRVTEGSLDPGDDIVTDNVATDNIGTAPTPRAPAVLIEVAGWRVAPATVLDAVLDALAESGMEVQRFEDSVAQLSGEGGRATLAVGTHDAGGDAPAVRVRLEVWGVAGDRLVRSVGLHITTIAPELCLRTRHVELLGAGDGGPVVLIDRPGSPEERD